MPLTSFFLPSCLRSSSSDFFLPFSFFFPATFHLMYFLQMIHFSSLFVLSPFSNNLLFPFMSSLLLPFCIFSYKLSFHPFFQLHFTFPPLFSSILLSFRGLSPPSFLQLPSSFFFATSSPLLPLVPLHFYSSLVFLYFPLCHPSPSFLLLLPFWSFILPPFLYHPILPPCLRSFHCSFQSCSRRSFFGKKT